MKVICKNCNKEFNKKPKEIKKTINHFCSRSCAAIYNNRAYPKRKKQKPKLHKCSNNECNILIKKRRKKCDSCIAKGYAKDMTISEVKYTKGFKSNAHTLIRSRAQQISKKLGWKKCKNCGYSKHIEVCHIKPISEFSEETLISVVNSTTNLIPLCPNCHWEFDHKELKLD